MDDIRESHRILDRTKMLAAVREVLAEVEAGTIELTGIALVVCGNRVHGSHRRVADVDGTATMSDRTLYVREEVALPLLSANEATSARHFLPNALRDAARRADTYLDFCESER